MNILQSITRAFTGTLSEPDEIDFAPITLNDAHVYAYRHHCKLLRAASRKLGGPFKCAANGLPRETLRDGHYVTVGPQAEAPKQTVGLRRVR